MGRPNVNVFISGPVNEEGSRIYKTAYLKSNIPFEAQITEPNTKYVVRYNYDLNGETVSVPEGCLLEFDGGRITNGTLEGSVAIINQPDNFFSDINCWNLNISTFKHLDLSDVNEMIDDYQQDGTFDYRHEQNVLGTSYLYEIKKESKVYFMKTGSYTPTVRYIFYDKDYILISSPDWSRAYECDVPENAEYVGFSLSFNASHIPYIKNVINNLSFSFLNNGRVYIDSVIKQNLGSSLSIRTSDKTKIWVSPEGIYKLYGSSTIWDSICIPFRLVSQYDYLRIKANNDHPCRVHILKEEPTIANQSVEYSDYYKDSIVVAKKQERDFRIPKDVKYIIIASQSGGTDNTPSSVKLLTQDYIVATREPEPIEQSARELNVYTQKFMHWNLGHFSNGSSPNTTINEDNYALKRTGFNNFVNTYCPDSHYLFNEYSPIFAVVNGSNITASSILFTSRKTLIDYPIINWNHNAGYLKEGLRSYKFVTFDSLKGVANTSGVEVYGDGYCLYTFYVGKAVITLCHVHLPHTLASADFEALDNELINELPSTNVIIVGDLNRTSAAAFSRYTDAGYTILNDDSVTFPSKGTTLDWVMYKVSSGITVTDFRVYPEAVDGEGELLSDHLPISFTVRQSQQAEVPLNMGNNRFNRSTLKPEWGDANNWKEADGMVSGTRRNGTWANRPTDASSIYEGFMYMINSGANHFPIYAHINGSTIEWYKADGTQYIGN